MTKTQLDAARLIRAAHDLISLPSFYSDESVKLAIDHLKEMVTNDEESQAVQALIKVIEVAKDL